jgi:hypothetical protein
MPVESNVNAFLQRVRDTVYASMAKTAQEARQDMQTEISEPWPPASAPATPPHLRTGNLQQGVSDDTRLGGANTIDSTIMSEREAGNPMVPIFLEFGVNAFAPRPYMGPGRQKWGPIFKENAARDLKGITPL